MRKENLMARLLVAAVVMSFIGFAQGATKYLYYKTTVCNQVPYVLYINGIMAPSPAEEIVAARMLQTKMDSRSVRHVGQVRSLYNPSEGAFLDIFRKLLSQKQIESSSLENGLSYIESAMLYAFGVSNNLSSSEGSVVQSAVEAALALVADKVVTDPQSQQVAAEFTTKVSDYLMGGYGVVVVAHSDGNMFAKQIYSAIAQTGASSYNPTGLSIQNALQMVNVATPAASADSGHYITSSSDLVITGAASLLATSYGLAQPAPANAYPGMWSGDISGHQFLGTYLSDQLNTNVPGNSQTMANAVVGMIAAAESQISAISTPNSANPTAPVILGGSSLNNDVLYTVNQTTTGGATQTTSVYVPATGGSLYVLQLTCSQLQAGSYVIDGLASPSRSGDIFNFEFGPFQFGFDSQILVEGLTAVNDINASRSALDYPVAELDVTENRTTGGFDLSLYGYH
jgi:hypothetical protein